MLICLTGVSGVGKSTVSKEAAGVCLCLDLDKVVHGLYALNQPGYVAVAKTFGAQYVTAHSVDRNKLRTLTFNNKTALNQLNTALVPCITNYLTQLRLAAQNSVVLVEAAAVLTMWDTYAQYFDKIICIDAPKHRIEAVCSQRYRDQQAFVAQLFNGAQHHPFDLVLYNDDAASCGAALRAFITPFVTWHNGF